MIDNVLYIIGNGFDLHHGVSSSYQAFHDWLRLRNRGLCWRLERCCRVDFLWSEFERALAYVCREEFLLAGELFLPTAWNPDKDSYAELLYAEDIARNEGCDFWNEIVRWFRKWVLTIRWKKDFDKNKVMLDTEARFITFNYTPFLETQYGIESDRILYLHGRGTSSKNPPILGHDGSDTFEEWYNHAPRSMRKYYHETYSQLPEVEMLTSGVEAYFMESEKPVRRIIRQHCDFFDDLWDIRHIYVMGHSLGNVDMPYFKRIIDCNNNPADIQWYISYYSDKEKVNLLERMRNLVRNEDVRILSFKMSEILRSRNGC